MIAGPVFAGATQFTTTVVDVASPKVGALGAAGGSSTSVTATVTVASVLAAPSLARTVSAKLGVVSKFSPLPV